MDLFFAMFLLQLGLFLFFNRLKLGFFFTFLNKKHIHSIIIAKQHMYIYASQ